ncbi:patatin-like phospholipase domain-containing protein 2 isoform X2 [Notolabrus celidotus]|uniref:patatin-like phospholipase domain-containing protein 2 isoform X2 n=1 Tax=Notolabrus celidotus TaxID=1203425 RepID=UPI00148FBE63|nr:patatin-like phospholipase domain-containing protein 2 isoform X2 [Notolabrus celidotus]
MGASEKMFDWDEEWNISFAGCGFRSVYYLGALSCILERAPQLVHGASKIGGASSGCLVAAALVVGIPIEEFCVDVLNTAKEARDHTLGVFHPTFSLLRTAKEFLQQKLPEDAHIKASGKLCVSLTRMSDCTNVLVSEFESREELIQVLVCSCFFPFYSGFIPPSYRGVRYMDGALSNNMPLFEQRNTITMAPFSGESDICPKEGTFNFFEATFGNVSIQVNTGNVHRVCTSFLPPKPEKLAEICHNGYMDALRFLTERDLLGSQNPQPGLEAETEGLRPACCELMETKKTLMEGHGGLDLKVIQNLPLGFKKVLCEACRNSRVGDSRWSQLSDFPPVRLFLYLIMLLVLPLELLLSLMKRLMISGCTVVCRLLKLNEDMCRRECSNRGEASNSFSNSNLKTETRGDKSIEYLTSTVPTKSNKTPLMGNNGHLEQFSFTSTSAGPSTS